MKLSNKQINTIFPIITAVCVLITAAIVVFNHRDDIKKPESEPVNAETTTEYVRPDGFYFQNGEWVYYENGIKSDRSDFVTGTVNGENALWYVKGGKVDLTHNALINKGSGKWLYVQNGKVIEMTGNAVASEISKMNKEQIPEGELALHNNSSMSDGVKNQLMDAVKTAENRGFEVGFYVLDLHTLEGFAYNADKRIYSASTIKGPYVVSAVENDNTVLEKQNHSITQILKNSSNEAYISMRNRCGDECFENFVAESGSDFVVDKYNDFQYITPRQLADLWLKTYIFFESGDTGRKLGEMFENPETSPIHSALSDKYKTRSKAGWVSTNGTRVTNDAGIVYAGDKVYLVSVMTTAPCNFLAVENLVEAIDTAINSIS